MTRDPVRTPPEFPLSPDQSWTAKAACHGRTELFFPPHAERPSARLAREAEAKHVCTECAVRAECRWFGRINHEHGIWGGETEEERIRAGYPLLAPVGNRRIRRNTLAS